MYMGGYTGVICKQYAILQKELGHPQILLSKGDPGTSLPQTLKDDCMYYIVIKFNLIAPPPEF